MDTTLTNRHNLTVAQLNRAGEHIAMLVEAISETPRNYAVEERVGVIETPSIWNLLFPPKHRVRAVVGVWATPFGGAKETSDFHGMLTWMPDGTLRIATLMSLPNKRTGKIRSPFYRAWNVADYVKFYLTANNELSVDTALENIDKAAYHLERLLDDGHLLKRPARADDPRM